MREHGARWQSNAMIDYNTLPLITVCLFGIETLKLRCRLRCVNAVVLLWSRSRYVAGDDDVSSRESVGLDWSVSSTSTVCPSLQHVGSSWRLFGVLRLSAVHSALEAHEVQSAEQRDSSVRLSDRTLSRSQSQRNLPSTMSRSAASFSPHILSFLLLGFAYIGADSLGKSCMR